ncbi:hypothetical protein EYD10_04288 [Varanus komodoensis]|nr:uncharacterized protein C3orf62 homolog isoform X2 [Varanus komodoensis]KAF7249883.1 hypothetical protein EYD10_04288 [Varanus komodoensis]
MSEKLRRCRKELTAAIDRAMEDLSIPFPPSPDPTTDQNSDLLITQPSTPPNTDLFNHKGEPIPPTVCCPQLSPPVSSAPEKENPLFRPSLIPVTVGSNISCTKREPLTSKENTWLHPPIFMADRQFFLSLEDSERWRKGHLSKTDERSMKSETSVTASDVPPQSPKDLADVGDNSAVWPAEKLPRKSDSVNELQQNSRMSDELFPLDEASALDLDVRSTFRKVLEYSPEDDAIIETLLDMEEEYRLNSSALHQPH